MRDKGDWWIDHATIIEDDLSWLSDAHTLTLWNVQAPARFFSRLKRLSWLDIRGGSGGDLSACAGLANIRYLAVNQVRGISDLSVIATLESLVYIDLYGLKQVRMLPSLSGLYQLRCARIGQMRGLPSLGGLLDAPRLEDLCLHNFVTVPPADVARINVHPTLQTFSWSFEDAPARLWEPVMKAVQLPSIPAHFPKNWFASRGMPLR